LAFVKPDTFKALDALSPDLMLIDNGAMKGLPHRLYSLRILTLVLEEKSFSLGSTRNDLLPKCLGLAHSVINGFNAIVKVLKAFGKEPFGFIFLAMNALCLDTMLLLKVFDRFI
jgi:hypothetical protein